MSLTESTIPENIERSLNEQVDRLGGLKAEILVAAMHPDFGESRAVKDTFTIISQLAATHRKSDDTGLIPGDLAELVVERFEPAFRGVVDELEELWNEVRTAVTHGKDAEELVTAYVEHCDSDNTSHAQRLYVAETEIEQLVLEYYEDEQDDQF